MRTAKAALFILSSSSSCMRTCAYRYTILRKQRLSTQVNANRSSIRAIQATSPNNLENIQKIFDRIDRTDDHVGAFISLHRNEAEESARQWDEKLSRGTANSTHLPLLGLPIAVKDNLCVAGKSTTAASSILLGYEPSYDATVVRKLKDAGGIIVGKTNMDEFSMGSTTETSAFKVTRNPRSLDHVPGGSSGGSAAAVAAGMVPVALGSDTGGSIRQPASWCGVVGLKPSYGRVSRSGLIAYASSLDCVGPIATCVMDAALVLSVISGPDPRNDATTKSAPLFEDLRALEAEVDSSNHPLKGVRIGIIKEALSAKNVDTAVHDSVTESIEVFRALGAEMVEVSFPKLPEQCAAYYVNALSEASANLARYDGVRYGTRDATAESSKQSVLRTRHKGFGAEVKKRILVGTFSLSAGYSDRYYLRSQSIIFDLKRDFNRVFERVDVLLCPTAPTTAYSIGEFERKGVDSYADDLFTVPASLAGLPAISMPCGVSASGLPIGLQIIGRMWDEEAIVKVAYAFESATSWHEQCAPGFNV